MNSGERLILAQSRMDGAEERMDEAHTAVNYAQRQALGGLITYEAFEKYNKHFYQRAQELLYARDAYWEAYGDYHNEEI